jgi:Protein of unknown function (DUF3634)
VRTLLILALILAVMFWIWGIRREGTLFTLVVKKGRITRSQGRIPARLFREIEEILERAGVTHAKIRGVVRDGSPVLQFDGEMSPGAQQQMRNVVGQFTTGEIRGGKK